MCPFPGDETLEGPGFHKKAHSMHQKNKTQGFLNENSMIPRGNAFMF
jgi:hypothetical protein